MKDYYYFLGLKKDASEEEIRRAYRKLSLKYHPDINENDEYFENRFREIQEAYETLINSEARKVYDQNFGYAEKSIRSNLPPHIKSFSADKIRAKKGDEIILNWQTNNADLVKILPFGTEKSFGERTFKITEFQGGKFHVVLQATNTLLNKSVVQGVTIHEVFENDAEKFQSDLGDLFKPQPRTIANPHGRPKIVVWFILFVLLIVLLIYFFN